MFFFCSHWSLVDIPLTSFCPADHVPDWQPRIVLGMVEARSVNVKKTTTLGITRGGLLSIRGRRGNGKPLFCVVNASRPSEHPQSGGKMSKRVCLKKNLNASRRSEHPTQGEKYVKTLRWDHRLQMCCVLHIHRSGLNPLPYPVIYVVANPIRGLLDRKR